MRCASYSFVAFMVGATAPAIVQPVAGQLPRSANSPRLEVRADPRIEVVSLMARFAGFGEYQVRGVPSYDSAVAEHFERFRNHPSVDVVRRLGAERGISHDALPAVAILAEPGTWRLRIAPDSIGVALDSRWDSSSVRQFLDAASRFDSASGATTFFSARDSEPRALEAQLVAALGDWIDIGWFAAQFGVPERSRFIVVPGLQNGPMNFGPHVRLPDGSVEYYQIIGTPTPDARGHVKYPLRELRSLFVHEMSHPFVNPWVAVHRRELEAGGRALFGAVRERMTANAYDDWETLLDESMARASTLRYFADHHDTVSLAATTRADVEQGFVWIDELAQAMASSTGSAPRLDGATASLVSYVDAWRDGPADRIRVKQTAIAREESARRARGPQIVRLVPADGDSSVAPGPITLEVHFDRPMSGSVKFLGPTPQLAGKPAWDDEKRVLRLPVVLSPGRYRFLLNDPDEPTTGFASKAGEVLYPRTWTFHVR